MVAVRNIAACVAWGTWAGTSVGLQQGCAVACKQGGAAPAGGAKAHSRESLQRQSGHLR